MQTVTRQQSRPELAAERRAAGAERRAGAAETNAAQDRAEAARLARDLAEMRDDRDRWRTQAERLAAALERLKVPVERAPAPVATETEKDADQDLLYGVPRIARHLGLSDRQVRHLADTGAIPTFRLPGNKIICARRSTLNAWVAERDPSAPHM